MSIERVTAVVATSHVVSKYGGFRLTREALQDMADQLSGGEVPMAWNHDPRRGIAATNVVARVKERDDGEFACVVEFDVDSAAWAKWQDELIEAGGPGGFSFATTLWRYHGGPDAAPSIDVAGEPGHFDVDEVAGLAAEMASVLVDASGNPDIVQLRVGEVVQFSATEEIARFVLEFGVDLFRALPAELIGAGLYDLVRRTLDRKKTSGRTMIDVNITEVDGARSLRAVIVTDDAELAAGAIRDLVAMEPVEPGVVEFDADERRWVPPS